MKERSRPATRRPATRGTARGGRVKAALKVDVGEQIPSIGLRSTDGYLLNLRTLVGKQPACFFFFAAPTVTGAERERGEALARAFAAGHGRLAKAGVTVIGVTCDSHRQQTEYVAAARLPYLLFSDERRTAAELLGVPVTSRGDNYNAGRVAIGVSADGAVRVILHDPDPATVVEQISAALSKPAPLATTA